MVRYLFQRTLFVIFISVSTYAFASFDLDVDDNGETDALTDGLLVLRHMFGLSGDTLTLGVVGGSAIRSESEAIESHLTAAGIKLDVDGDGDVDALTDGLLILRNLFGLSGDALISGVLSDTSERKTSDQVISYIATIKDSDNDDVVDSSDAFPFDSSETLDTDLDGVGNNDDLDDDGDGIPDEQDPAPLNASISDQEAYDLLDLDGDGVLNKYDSDDDGDGVLDGLDTDPSNSSMASPVEVMPWINEIKISLNDSQAVDKMDIVVAKVSASNCRSISVRPYDAQGLPVKRNEGSMHLDGEPGLILADVVGYYRGETGCDGIWLINNYDFVNAQFFSAEFDLSSIKGVYLEFGGSCIDVVSFGSDVRPANVNCELATHFDLPEGPDTSGGSSWARSGVGVKGNDFTAWYQDDRNGSISSGWTPYRNNYQWLTWSAPESPPTVNATELGVLEIPRPRNSVVKSLQDSGWSYPPISGDTLKIFQPSEVLDEHLKDDGQSDYVFASDKIRPDFLNFLDFMLGTYTGFMGGVRAENYMHHADYSSEVLNEIAFLRGNYDAKSCWEENGGPEFFSTGSGGGYLGMAEERYLNDKLYSCYRSAEGEAREVVGAPRRNFDASYFPGYDWPDEILTVGSQIDLGAQSEPAYGGTRPGKFRDELMSGHMHEWSHNWEAFHTIVGAEFGPKRFSHPVKGWADNPAVVHAPSVPFELYVREYLIHDKDYDGTEKLWSLKKYDERDIINDDFTGVDYLMEFRAGNQGVEQVWVAYLIKRYGLEKLYSEYYRRTASSGDYRVAFHQTYGKPLDELLQDAAAWASTVRTHEDFRLLFDSADEFKANLNQSFNVSLLQARNASTPNNRYQTLYTFVGDGEPEGVGESWMPVAFASGESLVFSENVTSDITPSATSQLQIDGHKAYFYIGDTSVLHAGGLAASDDWSAFTRRGERTSDLWFPVFIYDHDSDGLPDDYDPDYQAIYFTEDGRYKLDVWPGDDGFVALGQESETAFSN